MDKKTEQTLGIVIGTVGLLISVVSLAVALPHHGGPAAISATAGVFGIAAGIWLHKRARSLPPFSIKHVKTTFQITRPDGSECLTSKEVHFRCNYGGQTHFIQRHIYADGKIDAFRWVGDGILDKVTKDAGEHRVTILHKPSWPVDTDCSGTLTYSAHDTFAEAEASEWVAWVCDRSTTGAAEVQVLFPQQRPCKRAWACEQSLAGDTKHLPVPKVLDQATKVVLTVDHPRPGHEYYIYWEW
jgi:hypothetical protein